MNLADEQIREIAEDIDSGMDCYIHKTTGEIIAIPAGLLDFGDTEAWEDDLEKVEENPKDYIVIRKMDSNESYRIMEDFIDTVDDKRTRELLYRCINRPKPFANFKDEIQYSDEYLDKWYAYKKERLIEWVKRELKFRTNYDKDEEE